MPIRIVVGDHAAADTDKRLAVFLLVSVYLREQIRGGRPYSMRTTCPDPQRSHSGDLLRFLISGFFLGMDCGSV